MSIPGIIVVMKYQREEYTIHMGDKMISDRIKAIREEQGMTQARLASRLGITRSSVNAWEMGISVPSTQYVVELANVLKVSTDYLLGVDKTATISVAGLSEEDTQLVYSLVKHLREIRSLMAE